MGAVMLIHQPGGDPLVTPRANRYHLANTIGNLVDRAVTFASFVFGGIMDQCPDLKICLAHGGGYTCYGAAGWIAAGKSAPKPAPTYNNPPAPT